MEEMLRRLGLDGLMNIRFGIQLKTALLVMGVAVLAVLGTAGFLQRISADMVENHELVDLGDEANLRAWEIIDQVNSYREELGNLAADEIVREAVYNGEMEELSQRGAEICTRWPSYLRVQITSFDASPIGEPAVERARGFDPTHLQNLLYLAECESRTIPLMSKLVRAEGKVLIPGAVINDHPVWRERWMPVFWGCVRITPPPAWTGETRYLTTTFTLTPFRSPRHLFFLIDYDDPGKRFIIHPNMSMDEGFGEDGLFENDLREVFNQAKETATSLPLTPIQRVATLESEPLEEDYYFYFKEGIPTPALSNALAAKRDEDLQTYEAFFNAILEEHETTMSRRIGGLGSAVTQVRLLSSNREDHDHRHRGDPNFLQSVEEDLRFLAGLPQRQRLFDWRETLELQHCHISCLQLDLNTGDGRHRYLMMYAGFQEEFMGAIQQDIRSNLLSRILIYGLGGMVIASVAAAFFVRPIRQMTTTSQQILAEKGVLHEQLAKLATTLPVDRGDEVGDIARASKRLFEEIIESQEQLEQRVRDRTLDLEKANAKLEGLAKEKDAFLANVSHELRTPLTAVSGFLQLLQRKLQREAPLGDKEKAYVKKSLAAAAHLETLIDDILDFQKIIMGGITLDPSEFKMGDFFLELRDALQFQAKKNGNQLDFSWDHRLVTIYTDRHRLRQVLTNLISNACKFTHRGTVRLEAKRFKRDKGNWVRIRVLDDGKGMTREQQSRLFTRFYTTKQSNQSGTGLGLVISEGLTTIMGGTLYLESSAPGKGSVFAVELPMYCPAPDGPSPPAPVRAASAEPVLEL